MEDSSDSLSSSSDSDEDVQEDAKVKTAIMNLRQREDVAKYLRNLDPNSAAYDGKSRIMRDNPNPDIPESE